MSFTESTITFNCAGETLVGIVAAPAQPARRAVIVIVGGPQYRAGSHRQVVLLSRALAAAGLAVLRFDYRGMGDSGGEMRSFEQAHADVGAALDALQQQLPSVQEVMLWGLCDGASAALLYWQQTQDPRVRGLCLLNPWVRSAASLARAHVKHYYRQRLLQKEFWRRLLSGKVARKAVTELLQNLRLSRGRPASQDSGPFQQKMARAWAAFPGPILLLLSGDDYTAREFVEYVGMDAAWAGLLALPHVQQHEIAGADHTFSSAAWRAEVERLTVDWMESL